MNKTKLIRNIIIFIGIVLILFMFFYIKKSKNIRIGNNSSSQEIINNILNISSYETLIEMEVKSNKNSNKYIIKQKYISPDIIEQEVIQPENIQGIKILKNGEETKIENSKINISKIYNGYDAMTENYMDLITFIEEFKKEQSQKYEEKNNEIIIEVEDNDNKYIKYKNLYIDKNTGNPTKMEIKDDNKNIVVYILYKEVKLNIK